MPPPPHGLGDSAYNSSPPLTALFLERASDQGGWFGIEGKKAACSGAVRVAWIAGSLFGQRVRCGFGERL